MFVVDLVKDALTPPTQRDNAIMPECDHNTKIFGSWKKKKIYMPTNTATSIDWPTITEID